MAVTKTEIEHIAKLARISLTEDEKEKMARDMSSILDYIDKLNELDTKSVESIASITGLENVFRKDELCQTDNESREAIIEQFPHKKEDYLKVKQVFSTEGKN